MNIKQLEKAIKDSGLRKSDIISRSGISKGTLDNVLNGIDAKISTIESLAKVLGVKVGYFFDEEEISVRQAGRDYVERGKIEHKGTEYNAPVTLGSDKERELEKENADLRRQLIDAQQKIIKLMEERK